MRWTKDRLSASERAHEGGEKDCSSGVPRETAVGNPRVVEADFLDTAPTRRRFEPIGVGDDPAHEAVGRQYLERLRSLRLKVIEGGIGGFVPGTRPRAF